MNLKKNWIRSKIIEFLDRFSLQKAAVVASLLLQMTQSSPFHSSQQPFVHVVSSQTRPV